MNFVSKSLVMSALSMVVGLSFAFANEKYVLNDSNVPSGVRQSFTLVSLINFVGDTKNEHGEICRVTRHENELTYVECVNKGATDVELIKTLPTAEFNKRMQALNSFVGKNPPSFKGVFGLSSAEYAIAHIYGSLMMPRKPSSWEESVKPYTDALGAFVKIRYACLSRGEKERIEAKSCQVITSAFKFDLNSIAPQENSSYHTHIGLYAKGSVREALKKMLAFPIE